MRDLDSLLAQLTIEEKAMLLEGVNSWNTNTVERLDIPALFLTDGPHGLRKVRMAEGGFGVFNNEPSTVFPMSAAVASSWNPDNAYNMAEAIAKECESAEVDVLLAPSVNIKRSPLCGRNFEYYSEDPFLSGAMGSAFIRGAQSQGICCSVKHFAVNSNETYRFIGDSLVDERALREIYLRAFEMTVKEAKPYTVMCSYNRVNGTFASQNKRLLTDILREEWGFDGLVMTDWGATCDRVQGVAAGCDLDMPGEVQFNRQSIIEAVKNGTLAMEVIDYAVMRVLRLIETCTCNKQKMAFDSDVHAELSCTIAKDSAVLLKNDGILPLTGKEKLLVVGEMFEKMRFQGAGSSLINPLKVVTPMDAFDKRGVSYTYEKGYRSFYTGRDEELENMAIAAAKNADTVLFFGGLSDFEDSEGFDRDHMRLSENQTALIEALIATGRKVVLVLYSGAPVELPFLNGLSAMLDMYLPGMFGGEATAALLYGEVNPSGKLAESWPMCAEETSCFADFGRSPISVYYESIYVGYRFYDKAKTKLLFPFGYGLSYTSFVYSRLDVRTDGDTVTVQADIANNGSRDGAEVVQLYVKNAPSTVFKADKELRSFTKVYLKAGEIKTVTMTFKKSDLCYWDVVRSDWVLENGTYEICLAASSADIRLKADLEIADGFYVQTSYSEAVNKAYNMPPTKIPDCFAELIGRTESKTASSKPLTLESPLKDFKQTLMGRIIYTSVMNVFQKAYKKACKMPDSLERDARLKNTYFVMRMMPFNSVRSMCMSSGGRFAYNTALGLVEMANGHFIRALKIMWKK